MIYPAMRRKDRQLSSDEAYAIIDAAEYGVLSLSYQGYPYCVALSHALKENAIYFHCARQGFKADIISLNPNGYFLFVENAKTLRKEGSVAYRSCSAIGSLRLIDAPSEKLLALKLLAERHMGPEFEAQADEMIQKHAQETAVYAFDIIRVTGKHNS